MAKPEYDEFFYRGIPERIVELKDALVKNEDCHDILSNDYDKNLLYCPECHNGQLKFTPEYPPRRAYLSFIGNGETDHADGCSHKLPTAGKRESKVYYDNLTNQQIDNKLNAAINHFLKQIEPSRNISEDELFLRNPAVMSHHSNSEVTRKRLLTRSIYSIYKIDEDELNVPVLLYGIVKLSIEEKPSKYEYGENYYYLNINNRETNSRIRYFYRRNIKDDIDTDALYYIALIAMFERNDSGKLKSDLYTQNAIKYIKL